MDEHFEAKKKLTKKEDDEVIGLSRATSHASIISSHSHGDTIPEIPLPSGDYIPGANKHKNMAKWRTSAKMVGAVAANMDVRPNSDAAAVFLERGGARTQKALDATNDQISPRQAEALMERLEAEAAVKSGAIAVENQAIAEERKEEAAASAAANTRKDYAAN